MLTREQIRQRLKVKPVEVEVASLDGTVFARQLTLTQRRQLEEKEKAAEKDAAAFDSEVWLTMNGICDEQGAALFQNGDHEWLSSEAQATLVTDLAKAVLKANGWTEPEQDEDDEAGN